MEKNMKDVTKTVVCKEGEFLDGDLENFGFVTFGFPEKQESFLHQMILADLGLPTSHFPSITRNLPPWKWRHRFLKYPTHP